MKEDILRNRISQNPRANIPNTGQTVPWDVNVAKFGDPQTAIEKTAMISRVYRDPGIGQIDQSQHP
jgi:hypothetical protein